MKPRIPGLVLGLVTLSILVLSNQAHAALEEVTFQVPQVFDPNAPLGPHGPVAVGSLSGYFFFDTSQVTGGLLSVFEKPGVPPGGPGTANVLFGAGPSGAETITFNDGSVLTVPFTNGFSLGGGAISPVCGIFDLCHYTVGQVLTLSQFNAAPDPWALVTNGMTSGFLGFLGDATGLQGSGRFEVHSVPEPATLSLLGLGLVGIMLVRRRRSV